ncbi:MAG TPA: hypothetical protein VGI75_07750 [Pirellulales bacterium]
MRDRSQIAINAWQFLWIVIIVGMTAITTLAQQGVGTTNSAAASGSSAAKSPTEPTASGGDAADEKAKILASKPWQQISAAYQQWLESQAIYMPADIKRINAQLAAEIQAMPVSDLQEYIDDWQAKLKVLNGKDFQEAQKWLGYYLQPCTDGYRAKTLKQLGLTNVSQMSAADLENAILKIRADRLAMDQSQAAFEQSRQQQVQAMQQARATTRQAVTQAGSGENDRGAAGFDTLQSPYRPPKFNPPPAPHMQFYVNGWGQVGYLLPW